MMDMARKRQELARMKGGFEENEEWKVILYYKGWPMTFLIEFA